MISYITTTIPYVNARPHLGHALELVQADVLARHRRSRGHQVRLLTGTDDNAVKNVTAAEAAGVSVEDFVRDNGDAFVRLGERLGISRDDVIRTAFDPRHRRGVERLWHRVADSGDLYQRSYTGLYCEGCEQFCQPDELPQGRCPEHNTEPVVVEEENWFFRLTRYQDQIRQAIESGRVHIQPEHRRSEVLSLVRSGLTDFSVSRPSSRSRGWGIPVPGDPEQTVYVWWDALGNYVTALDYATADGGPGDRYRQWWRDSDERLHVIGKGVSRFHAVYWLGALLSAGEPLPTRIAVHEYLQTGGRKISKSGPVADDTRPDVLLDQYGTDALRWWLLRDVNRTEDTDFDPDRLLRRYRQDLSNTIGNLVTRTVSLVDRHFDGRLPVAEPDGPGADDHWRDDIAPAVRAAADLPATVDHQLARFDLRRASAAIVDTAASTNAAIEKTTPWRLVRSGDHQSLGRLLRELINLCRTITGELRPFLPEGAARLSASLGTGPTVGAPDPAFPRLETTST